MNKTAALTYNDFANVLRYEAETGKFFRLSLGPQLQPIGSEVLGTINSTGYVVLGFLRRPVLAHRIAWLLVTGSWPTAQIDHINRVKTDNRWVNLRPASVAQNNANAVKSRPREWPTGVRYRPKDKLKPFYASISVKNKDVHLGCFPDPQMAHQAYLQAKQRFHGPFNPHK